MNKINGYLMSRDMKIARINNDVIYPIKVELMPFYIKGDINIVDWLKNRAIDSSRVNSRILRKALKIKRTDDLGASFHVYGAKITDTYWVCPDDSNLTYKDIKFKKNDYADVALKTNVNVFNNPSANKHTPELTNTGSFEKCWKKHNGEWYLFKSGDNKQLASELIVYEIGKLLSFNMAEYYYDGQYVISKDFTNSASVILEEADGLIGEDTEDYLRNYCVFKEFGEHIAQSYVNMLFLDAICRNPDRHEKNYGVLRDVETGRVIDFAPIYDHNLALIASNDIRNEKNRINDIMISDFCDFIIDNNIKFEIPDIKYEDVQNIINNLNINVDCTNVTNFIMMGIEEIEKQLESNRKLEKELI